MRLHGTGSALLDFLYNRVDFEGEAFGRLKSRRPGDGGIVPGQLVFLDRFEKFCGMSYRKAIGRVAGDRPPDYLNVGGPGVVPMVLASQLLAPHGIVPAFFGLVGDDWIGDKIGEILNETPLNLDRYRRTKGRSPFTMVLSDPNYDEGHGERAFVNNIGAASDFGPENLPDAFFDADVVVFGATALVPRLHDNLTALLKKAKDAGAITAVNTVYDFRNEMKDPEGRWPMGDGDAAYPLIDLLIADREEALHLSGAATLDAAGDFFLERGLPAFIVTQGSKPVMYQATGGVFRECARSWLPVCESVRTRIASNPELAGDTTGCGDNFTGGVYANMILQLRARGGKRPLDLKQAVGVGICAGAAACFALGGIKIERSPGEKAREIRQILEDYLRQTDPEFYLTPLL